MTTPAETERFEEARRRLSIIRQAADLESLIKSPGWQYIFALRVAALERERKNLLTVDTGKLDVAIAALQRWQIAEKMHEEEARHINSIIDEAASIREGITVDDAILMEQLNEQSKSGDSGWRSDPAGY